MNFELSLPVFTDTEEERTIWFEEIYARCVDLAPEEMLTVFQFGKKFDAILEIIKDSDYNPDTNTENFVRIWTLQYGDTGSMEIVDESEYIPLIPNKDALFKELNRIWENEDFCTD